MNPQYHQRKSISDTYSGIQPEIAKITFTRIQMENLTLSDFKSYYKAYSIKKSAWFYAGVDN